MTISTHTLGQYDTLIVLLLVVAVEQSCDAVDANRQSLVFVCIFLNLVIGNLGSQLGIHKF